MNSRRSLILSLFLVASCSSAAPRAAPFYTEADHLASVDSRTDVPPYAAIGDSISIHDAFNAELTFSKCIDIDGTILLPEIGAIAVAGYTRTEIEELLAEKFSPYFYRLDLTVQILPAPKMYFIYGEVADPGQKVLAGDLTVAEAVELAGPSRVKANVGHVQLLRGEPQAPIALGVLPMHVRELDIIFVPPTLCAQLGYLMTAFDAWLRNWLRPAPILIVVDDQAGPA